MMKPNLKLLLLPLLLLSLLLLLLLRPSPSSSSMMGMVPCPRNDPPHMGHIPSTLAATIIHYATLNATPQQTPSEIAVTAGALRLRAPARFLVFGLGLDSPLWSALNLGGRTVFLEQDESWIAAARSRFPSLEAHHVRYATAVRDADRLMAVGRRPECSWAAAAAAAGGLRGSACGLKVEGMAEVFYEEEWDLIMVDAPTGWVAEAPGRMGAIYMAGAKARGRKGRGETDVFVHDVDRKVEDQFSREFLCQAYLVQQVGRLRHFRIPSYRNMTIIKEDAPFCPPP